MHTLNKDMSYLKIGICDDEQIYRQQSINWCKEFCEPTDISFEIVEFQSGEELIEYQGELDILVLDIELTGMDGIVAKDKLIEQGINVPIIFMTNHQEKIIDSFGRNVYGFIFKNDRREFFFKTLSKIVRELHDFCEIEIMQDGIHLLIKSKDIIRIEAYREYIWIYTIHGKYLKRERMKNISQVLLKYGFCKVDRSNIINFKYIRSVANGIELINNHKICVSKRINARFKESYAQYLRKNR